NYRNLHFSSGNSPTVIERFAYFPSFYSCRACRNDPTRIFGDYLEFQIDYTKSLSPTNGSWTLVNNWGFGYNTQTGNQYGGMKWVGTYSNGRTYAFEFGAGGFWYCFELTATGRRDTGKHVFNGYVDYNLNIWNVSGNSGGGNSGAGPVTYYKNAFTGF